MKLKANTLRGLYDLALKCKNYQDFLEQIYKLHRYISNIDFETMEKHINRALGNKIPDSDYADEEHVERKQM